MRSLIRWNPRRETTLADPFRVIDEWFDELWRGWPSLFDSDARRPLLRPAMDVVEITISGEMGDTIEKEDDRYHYRERSYGAFQRSLRLPNTVDKDKVEASFENGVLNITLPKLPQAQPKQITVKASKK